MPTVLPAQRHHTLPDPLAPVNQSHKPRGSRWAKYCLEVEPSVNWPVPVRYGLSTPPEDMTGVGLKPSISTSYGGKSHTVLKQSQSNAAAMPMARDALDARIGVPTTANQKSSARPNQLLGADEKKQTSNSIAPYLQIPSSINNSKGSLAEFAAQITCLFWFEKTSKLKLVEEPSPSFYAVPSILPETMPTMGFRKWVTTILSTTQVSQNVILLALMFIYRLKKFNPGVRGKKGSEFRLMTIALMMGNKFLDDNTYTNKTWAEVSGISVQEIHIMEVEFLSNVRYNLFVTKEDWDRWHIKLGLFAEYFDKASRLPPEADMAPTTPNLQLSPSPIPKSPGAELLPPNRATTLPSPNFSGSYATNQHWQPVSMQPSAGLSYSNRSPRQQPWGLDPMTMSRKRTSDMEMEEHPAKRLVRANNAGPSPLASLPPVIPSAGAPILPGTSVTTASVPRLPRPNLATSSASIAPNFVASSTQLPLPTTRSMSSVYTPVSAWNHQTPTSTTAIPQAVNPHGSTVAFPEPLRHQSPFTATSATISSATISPALSTYSVHTPQSRLSPSLVIDRNSPYRPVRAVNTLLFPPPSASLQQPRPLPFNQMHYQPLGKAISERKTGVLPYLQPEGWPEPPLAQANLIGVTGYRI